MLEIIDKYLQLWEDKELNRLPVAIEPEMADPEQGKGEWRIWKSIPSKVHDEEIKEIEDRIGHVFPESYKQFLKHKHFYDLYISQCNFCDHPVNIWRAKMTEMIFNGYPPEFLIEKGRIPFAVWSDWGLLCFDTTAECENNDYPIVLWDHELWDKFELKYKNFESMIVELDKEDEASRA